MSFETVIKRLQDGPAVLFIGQGYLSLESGTDHILSKIAAKYGNGKNLERRAYDMFVELGLSSKETDLFQWMQALCKSISVPSWLEDIGKFPWAAVYTTAYDTVLQRAFETGNRSVQPVVNDKYPVNEPRNRQRLHLSFLLGYIAALEPGDRPALHPLELGMRQGVYGALLRRLPTIITPKGLLVVEGYNVSDQLPLMSLYTELSRLGSHQILICSADEQLSNDQVVVDLVERGKAVVATESFAELLSRWKQEGHINVESRSEDAPYGRWMTIEKERVRIPQEVISRVSKTAFIPDDSTFYTDPHKSAEQRYQDFRRFLSAADVFPDWQGVAEGYAFKRDYYEVLKKEVIRQYQKKDRSEVPIVLTGQTSSGKTIAMAQLAFELRKEYHYPVLFIPKRYQRPDEDILAYFCQWAEENNAKNTVILWDGMLDLDPYYKLLRSLNNRGRNVILVCTRYLTEKLQEEQQVSKGNNWNFVEAPIELNPSERQRFEHYLESIDKDLAWEIKIDENDNLLALLFRSLPQERARISSGIHDEYNFFVKLLGDIRDIAPRNRTQFYQALYSAGIIREGEDTELFNKEFAVGAEIISIADFLIFTVMIAGQYGLRIPFELLLEAVEYDTFGSHIFRALNKVDLIRWYDDGSGNIELGPRTTLEAKLLARYAGGKKAESDYIILLLERIRTQPGQDFGGPDRQIEFAVQLLSEIGPNSTIAYKKSYYEITKVLRDLRESRIAYHPRLVLKEALFLRWIVRERKELDEIDETDLNLLLRAEQMVSDALDEFKPDNDRFIANYLRVELSTICGYLAKQYINMGDGNNARFYYRKVKSINNYAFSTNPGNFWALNIAFWTTEDILRSDILSMEERIDAESDLLSLIERVESEEVSPEHREDFEEKKYKFYDLVGKEVLAEKIYEAMMAKNYTAGIYLKARKMLGFEVTGAKQDTSKMERNLQTYRFLQEHMDVIRGDGRCLFLMLKTWWQSSTGHDFFEQEKQTVAFSPDNWDFCLHLTDLLIFTDARFLSATVYYVRALAQFHLELFSYALATFGDLQEQAYRFPYGRKRVSRYYLYSSVKGIAKVFSGTVAENVSHLKKNNKGELYVAELDLYIIFYLHEFGFSTLHKGDVVSNFHIAFNFLGPIAVPAKN